MMRALLDDVRFAIRGLMRTPGFAVTAVATLALGIAANTAVFSVVDRVLLRPLGYPEPDRLVRVFTARPEVGALRMTVSFPNYNDWRERNASFSGMGIFTMAAMNYTGGDRPQRLTAVRGSASLLPTLGFEAAIGRGFAPEEDRVGGERVVLISDGFWRRSFGADPGVVGRSILLDDLPHTVVGVLPPALERAWMPFDAMTPLPFDAAAYGRGWNAFRVFARLAPGVSLERARDDMSRVAAGLAEEFPVFKGYGVNVESVADVVVGTGARSTLYILAAAVGFVLLIACANVANLLLARGALREGEFALRAALGASRWRIARHVVAESLVLGVAAGLLGVFLAVWGVQILVAGLSSVVARTDGVGIDQRALAFTVALSLLSSILFGLLPALRGSASQPADSLKSGMRGAARTSPGGVWRDSLVVAQVALALALVVAGGQMVRSLVALWSVDPGFETERLTTAQLQLPQGRYRTDAERVAFYRNAIQRLRAVPGVSAAGAASALPLSGNDGNSWALVEGYEGPEQGGIFVGDVVVTPGYFEAMGVPLLRGRDFADADRADAPGVVVVNRRMAESLWPGVDPLGRRLRFGDDPSVPWLTVIGVVGDVRQVALSADLRFETYRPVAQRPASSMAVLARTRGDPLAVVNALRAAIWEVDPDLAVFGEMTMAQIREANSSGTASIAWLLTAFGAVALLLAAGGLFSVMSYVVSRRGHEIGIRIALGAPTRSVLWMVLGRALVLTVLGIAGGVVIAFALSGVLESLLFGISPTDPITIAGVAGLLVVVGLSASYFPARRAAAMPPVCAMRQE